MIEAIVIIIGFIVAIAGLIGCIIPGIPGPPLNFLSLVLLEIGIENAFSVDFYITWGLITVVVVLLDYVLPVWGAKAYKSSKYGIWGSVIGMILGIIFFPPFGMIIGLFLGAVIGELIAGKEHREALKVGTVTFVASILMILLKIAVSGIMIYYFVERSFDYIF
jgi:uncharacterized protein YqgC (DUF456 family)